MTGALVLLVMVLALLMLRQPLLVILLSVAAVVHIVWGRGQLDYILEDMWISLDKELILSIPMAAAEADSPPAMEDEATTAHDPSAWGTL